jgi:hypothetical protein
MQRPGPLRDIPLDRINLTNGLSHPSSFKQRSNKRPLSPNASPACIPAKRQLTCMDVRPSMEKDPHVIAWSSKTGRQTPARLHVFLPTGIVTPRKLDFGMPKPDSDLGDVIMNPAPHSQSTNRPPTPLLPPDAMDVDDAPSPVLATWLRDFPAPASTTERGSIHYPGFDVYPDKGDVFAILSSPRKLVAGGSPKRSKDAEKENVPPRAKLCRAVKASENVPEGGVSVVIPAIKCSALSEPGWETVFGDGVDYTLKSRLDPHNLVNRGQDLPWLTPGHTTFGDEMMVVSKQMWEGESGIACDEEDL